MTSISLTPSPQTLKAAQRAASSPHGFVNLTRLVRSLEDSDPLPIGESSSVTQRASAQKEWETVQYARALLSNLRNTNEQSSTSSVALDGIDRSLQNVEARYYDTLNAQPSSFLKPASLPLPANPATFKAPPSASTHSDAAGSTPESASQALNTPTSRTAPRRRGGDKGLTDYLAARQREDHHGGEAGLLPLVTVKQPKRRPNERDALLGGTTGGLGSAQLHEELGGQLAGMSHQLKLNALHFASSLDEEKTLLDQSQEALEKNLSATRDTKKHLSTVSKKGRGTTWMTLGIVLLVLILFVWTYMLIRFT